MANISHFYDGQMRRYIIQFVRMMSNFQYQTGKDKDGVQDLIKVPVRYGDINRQVANILRQGSENALVSVPQMAAYISNLALDRPRMMEPTHVDKIHVRERSYDPETKTYSGSQGNQHTIERIMAVPFTLTMNCDLFSNNTDQKLQILEQLLVLFNPALELQTTDNWLDWTSLSYVELTDITFSSRTIPNGTDDEIDIATLQFTIPIWLTPPAKIKKLGVIEKIIASVYDEDATGVDINGLVGSDLLSRQEITFGNYGLYVEDGTVRLLQSKNTLSEATGDNVAHVSPKKADAKTGSQLIYGKEIPWTPVVDVYGKITAGLSKIKLETAITTANNEDTITYVTGVIAEHPSESHLLMFTVDADSIPTDTVPQFAKIIDPTVTGPTGSETDRQRYLITQPIGTALHDLRILSLTHDGTNTVTANTSVVRELEATFVDAFSVQSQENDPQGMAFNTDGTKMFVTGKTGDDINEYALSSAFDVSTASFTDRRGIGDVSMGGANRPMAVQFNANGTKMFVLDEVQDRVNEYTLSTGFDVTSTVNYIDSFSVATQEQKPTGLAFNTDGTKMFVSGWKSDDINEYALTTGFDVSTASFTVAFAQGQDGDIRDVKFNTDGTVMFVLGRAGAGLSSVYRFTLTTGFDVSTATFEDSYFVGNQDTKAVSIEFNTDGTKMFVLGAQNNAVNEYTLNAVFDFSPASTTVPVVHGLGVGDTVRITGAVPGYYNGTIGVSSVPSTTSFTYNTVIPTASAASSSLPTADTSKTTAAGGVYVVPSPLVSPANGPIKGVTNRGPSAWGSLVASESDIIQYNSTTDKWNVDFDSSNVTNVQYATNDNNGMQFKWTGTQWQKSWEGEYEPGDWILDL